MADPPNDVTRDKAAPFEISKNLLFINSASSLVAMGLNVTVLVWLQRFLLSQISTEEYSLLPIVNSVMMFAPLLTTVLSSGVWRYTTAAYAEGNTFRVTQIASTMLPIQLCAGCLILVIGSMAVVYVDTLLTISPEYRPQAQLMLLLLILSLSIRMVMSPFLYGLQVRQRFVLLNAIETGGQFLKLAILFALLFAVSVKVLWVIVAAVSAGVVAELVKFTLSRRAVPSLRFQWNAVDWSIARQIVSFGGWSTLIAVSITITTSADAIILNKLGTPLDVTCFYLGALPLRFITMIGSTAGRPLRPVLVGMHATGQRERLRRVFMRGGRWALWITLFFAVPLMVYGRELVSLYVGSEYQTAGVVMLLLLLSVPLGYGTRMLYPLAEASANIRAVSLCNFGMSIFNLGLTLYLVGVLEMGAVGSGLGTAIATVLFYPLLFWPLGLKIAQVTFKNWIERTLWPGLLPAVVAGILLLVLKGAVSLDSWTNIAVCVTLGSVVYFAVLWTMGLRDEDRMVLSSMYEKIFTWPIADTLVRRWGRIRNRAKKS